MTDGYDQAALDAASREVHMMLLREGSSWGTKACEEMGRVFMTAYRKALPSAIAATSEFVSVPRKRLEQWVAWLKIRGEKVVQPPLLTDGMQTEMEAMLAAAPAPALSATGATSEFVSVPKEPTLEMWDAAWKSIGLPYRAKLSLHEIKTLFEKFHAAMLAAAPAPALPVAWRVKWTPNADWEHFGYNPGPFAGQWHCVEPLYAAPTSPVVEAEAISPWIKTTDRLPEIGDKVLVVCQAPNDYEPRVRKMVRLIPYEGARPDEYWWQDDFFGSNRHQNALPKNEWAHFWMPLPTAPDGPFMKQGSHP